MNARNFQKEMDVTLARLADEGRAPSLLLHSCCAPCSSYVLECLSSHFKVTVFYYDPNIYPPQEYYLREGEQERFINDFNREETGPGGYPVGFMKGAYEPAAYYEAVRGLENEPEGGARCTECFRLRLYETAKAAKEGGFEYFTTTLSISPLKDAARLNMLGERAAERYGVRYLNSDFKKKDGYKRSLELSRHYGLYRQNYCGCEFSREKRDLNG